jgi:hypothetical protein
MPEHPAPEERTLRIPTELAEQLQRRIEGSGFSTIDEFAAFVLARLLEEPATEPFSEEEERRVRERLRSLGYID